jgi:hypothetical protein
VGFEGRTPGPDDEIDPDFSRLRDTRPDYGYAGIIDPNRHVAAPDNAGIWRLDLVSGKHELMIPFSRGCRDRKPISRDSSSFTGGTSPDGGRQIYMIDISRVVSR